MADVFSKVGGYKPGKTAFNLKHSNLIDCNFGQLVPVDCIECLPGDTFKLDCSVVGRLTNALSSPILADMDVVLEAFFCPTRLLMGSDANFEVPVGERNFEEFLVGGKDGKENISLPVIEDPLDANGLSFQYGGIGDYLGIQPNVTISHLDAPIVFPWRAYRWIWNEYYRFEALQEEIQVCQILGDSSLAFKFYDKLLYRGWRRDYFTSALPYQQFGTSPAFSIDGTLPVDISGGSVTFDNTLLPVSVTTANYSNPYSSGGSYVSLDLLQVRGTGSKSSSLSGNFWNGDTENDKYTRNSVTLSGTANASSITGSVSLNGSVNLNNAVTFDVSDIRTNFQIQKWMERNARGGVRYTEYLQSHFGVSPKDSRLQRPEFIGAFRMPWLVNEVVQTSSSVSDGSSVSPQGNQAGQAIALGRGSLGKYRCYEFGYILVIASVVPKPAYQQGIPRMFSRKTKLDFYSPEFAHLSEQAVLNKELYVTGNTEKDNGIFGFQGIWNELRYLPNRVSNHMRSNNTEYSFDYWHLARLFSRTPILNKEFLEIGSTESSLAELMRVFAVQDENPFILNIGFNFRASRPLPYLAEPGLVDHF